jgi:hypothetical protein
MPGVTLDTGALIGLERRERRMTARFAAWSADNSVVTVPSVVVAEWWRGQRGPVAHLLDAFVVEPTSRVLAENLGNSRKQRFAPLLGVPST